MAQVIKLVKDDNRPYIRLTLTDGVDGTAINLADGGTSVVVYFRAAGASTTLATLTCTKPGGGADGVVQFNFPSTTLNVPEGNYEGEVEISFVGGDKQTVYDLLKFKVRNDFT
jgi:hypothetical protein